MLAAAILIAMYPDWVPARWISADPKSLDLLTNTPINCLWLERPQWSAEFAAEAAKRGIATLGVIRREGDPIDAARAPARKPASPARVIEGNFDDYSMLIIARHAGPGAKMFYLESGPRSRRPVRRRSADYFDIPGHVARDPRRKGQHGQRGPHRQPLDRHQHRLHPLRPRCSPIRVHWIA